MTWALGRGEQVSCCGVSRRRCRDRRGGEGAVVLQYRQYAAREEAHVLFRLVVWDAAEREFGHDMVGAGHPLQFGDLLDAVLGRADDLDLDVELGRPDPLLLALQAGIGL